MSAITSGVAKLTTAARPVATMAEHLGHLGKARTLFDEVSLRALQGAPHSDVSGGWRNLAKLLQQGVDSNPGIQGYRGLTLDKGVAAAKRLEVGMPRTRDLNTVHAAIGNAKANAVRAKVATKIEAGVAERSAVAARHAKVDPSALAAGDRATAVIRQGEHLNGVAPGQRFAAIDQYIARSKPVEVVDFGVTGASKGAASITHAPPFSKEEIVQLRGLNAEQASRIPGNAQFWTV
ncbi:MAG: hypothetical protein JWN72_1737 [Thermoleophilia bacterium]|nr:hypothetical protein [Thermoleophilia bacterium]